MYQLCYSIMPTHYSICMEILDVINSNKLKKHVCANIKKKHSNDEPKRRKFQIKFGESYIKQTELWWLSRFYLFYSGHSSISRCIV